MDPITKYIMTHSDGRQNPICGSAIAAALGISGIEVRKRINHARNNGDPICSNAKGYYIAQDIAEIQETIDSLQGRIRSMEEAISGLQMCLRGR